MINKIAPLLGLGNITSEDLIRKGIEKVNPKFKKFFSESSKYGYPIGAALGFLRSTLSTNPTDESLRPDESANIERSHQKAIPERVAGTAGNILGGAALGGIGSAVASSLGQSPGRGQSEQQSSDQDQQPTGAQGFISKHPELGAYLDNLIKAGNSPEVAAETAKTQKKFAPIIQSIEERMGQDFVDLINQLYQGTGQFQGSKPQQPKQGGANSELAGLLQQYIDLKRGR